MLDPRLATLAKNLVNYSTGVKKGDKVLITGLDCDPNFIARIVDEIYLAGGMPFVRYSVSPIGLHVSKKATKEYYQALFRYNKTLHSEIQCLINIAGDLNKFDGKNVPPEIIKTSGIVYGRPLHEIMDKNKVRWVLLEFPNPSVAQEAKMETEEFEDYFFKVCCLDYSKMDKAMDSLGKLMLKTDKVRIVTPPHTDLSFSIKGQSYKKCSGHYNIPDGEVFTSPIKTSINGTVQFNAPLNRDGKVYHDIRLTFKDGKVIDHDCSDKEGFRNTLDTDEGARFVGEFALGVNPYIKTPMANALFDEKISGSWHMALGQCLEETPNGNKSAIHCDIVQIQLPQYGGGQIYFDDVLIRKNGKFVLKELECLNPENLK